MKQLYTSQLPQDVRDLLDTLVSEIKNLQIELEEVRQLMAISEADFTLLQNKVNNIETNLNTLTQTVTDLQSGTSTDITSLQQADTAFTTDIGNLKQADTDINTALVNLQEADTNFGTTLQGILDRLNAMETKHLTMAARDLTLPYTQVTEDMTLPVTDEYESTITWVSSNEAYITAAGVVTRPAYEVGNQFVTLTATIEYGEQTTTKDFVIEVIALEAPPEPAPTEPEPTV